MPKGHWLWGNTFDIGKAIEQFRKWQKEYGDIYRLNIAGLKVIMVCRLNCHFSSRIKWEKVSHTGRIQIKVLTISQFFFLLFLASNDNIKNLKCAIDGGLILLTNWRCGFTPHNTGNDFLQNIAILSSSYIALCYLKCLIFLFNILLSKSLVGQTY